MRKHLPPWKSLLGMTLPQFANYKIIDRIDSGANGHVLKAHSDRIEADLAFKFVPIENLPHDTSDRDRYLEEIKTQNILENDAVVRCLDVIPWESVELDRTFIVFVYPYIPGCSLRKFMKGSRSEITISFIESLLRTMLDLLYELKLRNREHGDLHAGNILVSSSRYSINERIIFRVIDFGMSGIVSIEQRSDYLYLADILHQLLRCIEYSDLTSRDRYVYNILKDDFLRRHLLETDITADPLARNPTGLFDKLRGVDEQFRQLNQQRNQLPILTPFDYPSCEQMGNSHLLLKTLYSDHLLGLPQIQARTNLVLTGPRGCGKTTVCRALSLDYMTIINDDHPDKVDFVGIYYRCDDLYFSFPRYEAPQRREAIDIPMHYVVVSLIQQTLQFLIPWARKYFREEISAAEAEVVRTLYDIVGIQHVSTPGQVELSSLISTLEKQRRRAAKKQRFCNVPTEPIEGYCGPEALFRVCAMLRSELSFLGDRPFIYFIDDYSTPKITSALQRNLNRLFMHRTPDAFFKLSTESPISFERGDIDQKEFVEQREYELLNLGLSYLKCDGNQIRTFLRDLFRRRFGAVDSFSCDSLDTLIGSYARNENETARQFRENRGKNTFWGVETVSAMCSGDIHYIIRLVGKMVDDVGGVDFVNSTATVPMISADRQSRTIRAAAAEFVEAVRNLPGHGEQLARIVSSFGNVAASYLRYRDARNVSGSPPHQASRIEPYGPLELSHPALDLLNDLIRFSILVMDPRGKSRRGHIVPRYYIRRYLLPHFNLTFSRRDSLELENHEIELLLLEPGMFENNRRLRSRDDSGTDGLDHRQRQLFRVSGGSDDG